MQPFAAFQADVMGRTIPDSGTAGRLDEYGVGERPDAPHDQSRRHPLNERNLRRRPINGGDYRLWLLGSVRPLARGMSPMVAAEGASGSRRPDEQPLRTLIPITPAP